MDLMERIAGLPEWPNRDKYREDGTRYSNAIIYWYESNLEDAALARLALALEAIQGALDATAIGDDVAFSALSRDDVIALLKALEVPK